MVGLSNAVELVTGGETIDAARGRRRWAWPTTSSTPAVIAMLLVAAAIRMIRAEQESGDFAAIASGGRSRSTISDTELGFLGATASAYIQQQTKGHYPAPLAALEVMLGAAGVDLETACQMEAEEFAKLFGSPINRALLNVFFLRGPQQERPGRRQGCRAAQDCLGRRRRRRRDGAGHRGGQREARHSRRDHGCQPEALARGVQGVLNEVAYNKQIKGPDVKRAVELAPLVNGTLSRRRAVPLGPGRRSDHRKAPTPSSTLFARLEPLLREDAILCFEHVDDSDHAAGRRAGAAGAVLRAALLQSRAADAAGRSDSRQARRATRRSPPPSPMPGRSASRRSW